MTSRLSIASRFTRGQFGVRPCVFAFLVVLCALVPLADAAPPDQPWILGIYDEADFDDVVIAVTTTSAALVRGDLLAGAAAPIVVVPVVVGPAERPRSVTLQPGHGRAPPA